MKKASKFKRLTKPVEPTEPKLYTEEDSDIYIDWGDKLTDICEAVQAKDPDNFDSYQIHYENDIFGDMRLRLLKKVKVKDYDEKLERYQKRRKNYEERLARYNEQEAAVDKIIRMLEVAKPEELPKIQEMLNSVKST